jgi:hypothetical protein
MMRKISVFLTSVIFGSACAENMFLAKSNHTNVKELIFQQVMGEDHFDHSELPSIQKALEPMWLALPKNSHGNLDAPQVRYALHRFFVQRHGWHIAGLERLDGPATELASLRERFPAFLMEVFEEAFGTTGLKQDELSKFAATLEHIIHDEAVGRLHDVYDELTVSTGDRLNLAEVDIVTDAYMMSLLLGLHRLKQKGSIKAKFRKLASIYPGWSDTQLWLRDVRQTVLLQNEGSKNPFVEDKGLSFTDVEKVVEQVSQRFGSFQNNECQMLKDVLLEAEDSFANGRVLLSDFYKKGIEKNHLFKESVEYLREQGVLDETKPGQPRVIVSNFLLSPGNCLADTGLYSICCVNECDGLLAHIEQSVSGPDAKPEDLIEIVSNLHSATIEAPRTLSARLVSQLELVAMRHGGRVPLHSRSLAQWLHVAFPHECPYPHATSAKSSLSTSEMKAKLKDSRTNVDERLEYIQEAEQKEITASAAPDERKESEAAEEELLSQWSHEEEILFMPNKPSIFGKFARVFGVVAFAVVAFAMVFAAVTESMRRCQDGDSRAATAAKDNGAAMFRGSTQGAAMYRGPKVHDV